MKNLLTKLLDLIYRKKCYFCGKSNENTAMCSECYRTIKYKDTTANRIIQNTKVYCACDYSENMQKLIRGLKYHNQKDLAHFQAKIMFEYWNKIKNKDSIYQIVPVPLYKTREQKRKYNQMKLVAEELSKLTGFEQNTDLIKRIKNTKPQYKLSKKQRMENLSNAFEIDKAKLKNGTILLIDDICTTGATFESITNELKNNGIENITCFATSTPTEKE